jgi:glycosidase
MNDWYETVKLNYGVDYYAGGVGHFNPIPNTWDKMTDILLFWAAKGVDGFRCDMAEMVPAAFWHWATDKVKYRYPECVFIGEVYNPAEYRNYLGAGFDYLYDKVGMYDTVRSVICGQQSTHAITGAWQQTDDIKQHMLYFLENHDEQRVASDFFAGDGRKGIPGLVVSALLQQNPLMIYFGQEYGERGMDKEGFSGCDGRTTIFDYWSVDTMVRAANRKYTIREKYIYDMYRKVMTLAQKEKAITQGEMFDLMYANAHLQRQYAFIRKHGGEAILVIANFADQATTLNVNIPAHAFDYLGLSEKNAQVTDLLTDTKSRLHFKRDESVQVEVPSNGAAILKFRA